MRATISGARFTMLLLGVFTGLAVLLAAVGLYGTMAYAVAQRTREIGIRIALGATRSRIASGVLANGVGLAVVGLVVGLFGAVWATKLIQKMLYGVGPNDPVAFIASGIVLLIVAVVACVVPTRRATSVDAMVAMRAD
jgi:ABC-type antimicrobial peptide transport system permease subunit